MDEYRIDKDSLGDVKIPKEAYWGAQTQRAIDNFPVSGIAFSSPFIRSMAIIKRACASVNRDMNLLDRRSADAIAKACDEIIDGRFADQFPLDIFQTGSGTSTNMNVNEVVATRANEILTGQKNGKKPVHPNDHVNKGQSSNDVIPTAIHVTACVQVIESLLPALSALEDAIREKQNQYGTVVKTGRTHLMDAMPITVGQEMSAWATQVEHAAARIKNTLPGVSELALGGTAVGTGINSSKDFGSRVAAEISKLTNREFKEAANHFEAQSTQDAIVELSGQLKTYAASLLKISNDLRLMNSGPIAGIAEIRLPELQPGSSIMPGKINPVIPEAARMACVQVLGNDAIIGIANALGDFQLNTVLPLIAHAIIQSITLLAHVSQLLAEKTIKGLEIDAERMADLVDRNPIIATVLNPLIGYDKAAEVVKRAVKEMKTVQQVVVEMGYFTPEEANKVLNPVSMTKSEYPGE
jgi:fumarate hydratase class II